MHLEDHLDRVLTPDEQEILLTYKKHKKVQKQKSYFTNNFGILLAFSFLIVASGLVIHFGGFVRKNRELPSSQEILKFADELISQQNTLNEDNKNISINDLQLDKLMTDDQILLNITDNIFPQIEKQNDLDDEQNIQNITNEQQIKSSTNNLVLIQTAQNQKLTGQSKSQKNQNQVKHLKQENQDAKQKELKQQNKQKSSHTKKQKNNNFDDLISYSEDASKITKPQIDTKQYRYLLLGNDLKVLLVSDQASKQCQAALNVLAGSWQEPDEFPGLAHFLEHMLFQGSETYPSSGYFEKLVSSGGGYTNAYTQGTKTNYYFSINSEQMQDALNVFAHFFIDPLLSDSMVDKEVNAVNSEYEIDVSGDGWKLMHLFTMMSVKNHPLSRFTIGNNNSLKKNNIVQALKQFHSQYYSSNLMALVIKSPESLDQLEQWVKSSDFKNIPNKQLTKPDYTKFGYPMDASSLGSIIKYHVNSHSKTILFTYQLQDSEIHYQTKPIEFLDSFVKSKHENGLYAYLLSQNLALDIDAGSFLEGDGAFSFYLIQIVLNDETPDINEQAIIIAQAITAYFNRMMNLFYVNDDTHKIKSTKLLKEMWGEKQSMGDVQFRFLEDSESNPLSDIFHLSNNLNTFPPSEVLTADFLYKHFDDKIIYNYLKNLINPKNMIILIGDSEYKYQEQQQQQQQQVFLQEGSGKQNDIKFISNKQLKNRNELFRIDWDMKHLTQNSIDQIININKNSIKDSLVRLQQLNLPVINTYVPQNLAMKSLCDTPIDGKYNMQFNQLRGLQQSNQISLLQNPYKYLPNEESLDTSEQYQQRLNQFIQKKQLYFTSKEQCLKHEMEYELNNKFPQLIKKDIEGRSWWKLQRQYNVPSVFAGLKLETAINMKTLKQQSLLDVFNEFISDKLYEKLQQSFEAGYKLGFDSSQNGITLEMYGWSDKFQQFYKDVITTVNENDLDSQENEIARMDRARSGLITQLQNTYERKLYQQSLSTYLPQVMYTDYYTPDQYIKELENISFENLIQFQKEMLNNFRFTSFIGGNALKSDAEALVNQLKNVFKESTSQVRYDNQELGVQNLTGKSVMMPFISQSTDQLDLNGVTLNYYQIGRRDQKEYAMMNLIQGQFQNQAYNYLRTQLQLGYVVSAKFRPIGCIDGASILVQGTAQPPYIVNQHIEEYIQKFGDYLQQLQQEEFNEIKQAAVSVLTENIKSLEDETQYMWTHIKYEDLAFEEKQVAASMISQVTKEDIISFYNRIFLSNSQTGKLSIQIYGKGMIKDTMKIDNDGFNDFIAQQVLSKKYSSADQREQVAFTNEQFKSNPPNNYVCNYKVSNI